MKMRLMAAVTAFCLAGMPGMGVPERTNVLFIVADDLNDWVGCLGGHPLVKTPHIDALAQRGVVFTNAHCQAPLCNPSRTSVLLGKRPETTGIYGLKPWFRDVSGLRETVSLPQYFSRNGYRTLATGKIFHGRFGMRKEDREFDVTGPGYDDGPYPLQRIAALPGRQNRGNDWGVVGGRDEERGDWKIASWAVELLRSAPQFPFFLSVGIRLPHVPLFATQQWFDLYPDDQSVLPLVKRGDRGDTPRSSWYLHWQLPEHRREFLEGAGQWQGQVRAYLACVSFLDEQVGRILQALRESGLEKNTIVVFWSDHGWHLGEKGITGKNTLWEESTRVPLVFAGPGVTGGLRNATPVELLDIYPTLLDLCGLPARGAELEGVSLRAMLQGGAPSQPRLARTTAGPGNQSVRSEGFRFIRYADGSEELYDLREDPHEWVNLAHRKELKSLIRGYRGQVSGTFAPPVRGSGGRVLEWDKGRPIWEGREIPAGAPIPGRKAR